MDDRDKTQKAQAGRIGAFLARLAEDDALLGKYIRGRRAVLEDEVEDGRLTTEDVELLLDDDYSRVSDVMSKGEGEPQWWIVCWWLVGDDS